MRQTQGGKLNAVVAQAATPMSAAGATPPLRNAFDAAALSFRPLQRADLPTLHDWLGRPHVAQWWSGTPSLAEVEADVAPMLAPGSTTRGFIALLGGRPIGFIQSYVVMGSGDGWWEDERDPGARGIDQFLANADELGRGLGSAVVRAFVDGLLCDPEVTQVQTDPSPANGRAIRCYRRAGFEPLREVLTPDGPALLMVCRRPAPLADSRRPQAHRLESPDPPEVIAR